jgi:hypothetical protein
MTLELIRQAAGIPIIFSIVARSGFIFLEEFTDALESMEWDLDSLKADQGRDAGEEEEDNEMDVDPSSINEATDNKTLHIKNTELDVGEFIVSVVDVGDTLSGPCDLTRLQPVEEEDGMEKLFEVDWTTEHPL